MDSSEKPSSVPKLSAVPSSCDTAAGVTVTPSRSYRTINPVLPHEETLVRWWRTAEELADAPGSGFWSQITDWCYGAAAVLRRMPNQAQTVMDLEAAMDLAAMRDRLCRGVPERIRGLDRTVSQERDTATLDMFDQVGA